MRSFLLTGLLLAGMFLPAVGTASAGDGAGPNSLPAVTGPHPPIWRFNGQPQDMPFPRSGRSQTIWASGTCWSDCGAYCAWGLDQCLYNDDTQGSCVLRTDSCDLYCQRACRSGSGPFLPID